MSGIGENVAQEAKNAKTEALFNAKSRADEIVKTVGEAKMFISGKPLLNKVGKVVKGKIQKSLKEGEQKFGKLFKKPEETPGQGAERRLGVTDEEAEAYFKGPGGNAGVPEPPAVNADVTPNDAGPSRLDELRQKVANREKEAKDAKDAEQAEKDANDAAEARGAKDPAATGEEETIEMTDLGGGTGAEIPNKAFDPASAEGGEVSFAGEGASTTGGDIALQGGFNAGSDPVFSSVMSQSRGQNLQNPFANARQNKFNPQREDGQSNSTPRSQPAEPETQPTADAPVTSTQAGTEAAGTEASATGGLDADAAKAAAEAAAKAAAKKAAEAGSEELAGGEAAGGILDAIPGGEVLGLLVGGIMAAVAAHKAHKAEEEEESADKAPVNPTTFSYQAGIGTD